MSNLTLSDPTPDTLPQPTSVSAGEAEGGRVAFPYTATLTLEPTDERPRRLTLELVGKTLFVTLIRRYGGYLCGSNALIAACSLDLDDYSFVRIGDATTFLVSADEAMRVRAAFEPYGLRVRES
jgi:hypothetical protein